MRKTMMLSCVLTLWMFSLAQASDIQLGVLAGEAQLGEVAEAAYDWAKNSYPSTLLIADGSGHFQTEAGSTQALENFAVLWLHYSASNALQQTLLEAATKDAVLDYLNSGGALFLSAVAVHYTFDLEVDTDAEPRVFSPLGKDPPEIGVTPTNDGADHPVFRGFDTGGPIYFCSMAQEGFTSDFMNHAELSGVLLATKTRGGGAGVGERPVVEYEVGSGRILTLGHHNAVYTDDSSTEGENLRQFTANVIEYLASKSAFMPVEAEGKLALSWAGLKTIRQ